MTSGVGVSCFSPSAGEGLSSCCGPSDVSSKRVTTGSWYDSGGGGVVRTTSLIAVGGGVSDWRGLKMSKWFPWFNFSVSVKTDAGVVE